VGCTWEEVGAILQAYRARLLLSCRVDDESNAATQFIVHVVLLAGGEDCQAGVFLHSFEEVAGLRSLSEERVGFVEEQDGSRSLRGPEDQIQILLSLTGVLAHDASEINAVQIFCERRCDGLARDDRGSRRRTDEERRCATTAASLD